MTLNEIRNRIHKADETASRMAMEHWRHVGKPLYALGKLEDAVNQIAGIQGTPDICIDRRALIIMCADNGVVKEGVSQTGQEVTALVTANFKKGVSCAAIMAKMADCEVIPVDIGVASFVEGVTREEDKVSCGTKDFLEEPAMTRDEVLKAINVGIRKVKEAKDRGVNLLLTGEMGIGNTTTSSAVLSVLLGCPVEEVTGKGAGLSDAGLLRKIEVIKQGIERHQPDPKDPVDVLSKVGGLDIAGLAGVFLGGAVYHVPVIIDGLISSVAALCAVRLIPEAEDYILASHVSKEPAGMMVLNTLHKSPLITADMCVGEGTGAAALLPLLDMGVKIYREMASFSEIAVEEYRDFRKEEA